MLQKKLRIFCWVIESPDAAADGVAFFFKQWGGTNKKRAGRLLDGRTHEQLPGRKDLAEKKLTIQAKLFA
jgi:protein gp37